jgi:hypothetical protein
MARLLPFGGYARFVLPVLVAGAALIVATGANADKVISTTTPFSFAGTNTCVVPAEDFFGSGHVHTLITDNLSDSGHLQLHFEGNFAGLQAVTVGPLPNPPKKYVVIEEDDLLITGDTTDGMPAHETFEGTVRFVRSGEDGTLLMDDDFYMHFVMHVTFNANGTMTVNDVNASSDPCR